MVEVTPPASTPGDPDASTRSGRGPAPAVTEDVAWFRHGDASMPGAVRRAAAALAEGLGFGPVRVEEVSIAVVEAATNLQRHADDGALLLRSVRHGDRRGVELVAVDSGPGIGDVSWARSDGSSTGGTLGIGLGAILRLADSSDLHSVPGRGTVLVLRFQAVRDGGRGGPRRADGGPSKAEGDRAAQAPGHDTATGGASSGGALAGGARVDDVRVDDVAGLTRPITGEHVCGDAYAVRRDGGRTTLMLCDGLGHGPLAARASQEAVRCFLTAPPGPPDAHIGVLHRGLAGTRGGAVSVAELDPAAGVVRFCGLGNVVGMVLTETERRGMTALPGIAGHHARSLRMFEYPLPAGAHVALHSDGLTDRWKPSDTPGLLSHGPLLVAATLLRDAGLRRDDACVLVARAPRPRPRAAG